MSEEESKTAKNGEKEAEFAENEGEADPRVQEELEKLNQAGSEINDLETKLTQARNDYRTTLHQISLELKTVEKRLGSCVKKARPYYEARSKYRVALNAAQRATESFEHAVSRHSAAREMVAVAEASLDSSAGARAEEKLAWAEMLNSATEKVNLAESERAKAFCEHTEKLTAFQLLERKMNALQKSLKRSILASKPYFQEKAQKMKNVEDRRNEVTNIENQLAMSKSDYQAALRTLETISEQIHLQRKLEKLEVSGNSLLTVPDENGGTIGDSTSFRSVLSDLNRADSTEHIDNLSDPSDIDAADRLSVDSGLWTPGSGGSRNGSGRSRIQRLAQANGISPSPNPEEPSSAPGPSGTLSSRFRAPTTSSSSSNSRSSPKAEISQNSPYTDPFAETRRPTIKKMPKKENSSVNPQASSRPISVNGHGSESRENASGRKSPPKMVSLDVRKLSSHF